MYQSVILPKDVFRGTCVSFENNIKTHQNKSVNLNLSINQLASIKQLENITKKTIFIGFQNLPLIDSLIIDDNIILTKIFSKQFSITGRGSSLIHFNPDNFNLDDSNVNQNDSFLEYNKSLSNIENKSFSELTSFIKNIQSLSLFTQARRCFIKKELSFNDTERVFLQQLLKSKETQLSLKKFVDKILQFLNHQLCSVVYLDWDYHFNLPFNGADVAKELKQINSDIFIVLITSSTFDNILKRLSLDYIDGIFISQINANDFNISSIELNNYLSDFFKDNSTPHLIPENNVKKVFCSKSSEFRASVYVSNSNSSYFYHEKYIPHKQSSFTRCFLNPLNRFFSRINCISANAVRNPNLYI